MRLLRSYPALSFALVLVSIIALCLAQGNVGLLIISGALAALSWYITEGPRSKHLPRWVSNVLVIAVSLHVVADLMQNRHDVLGVLGRFIVLLTLIKLYERRTARDHAQLLTLSLLLMVTGCLQSTDLLFGALLVVYAMLGMYVLLLHQLYAAYDDSRRARLEAMPSGYRLAPSLRPVTGRGVAGQFRSFVVVVAVVGLLLSVTAFVAFPRGIGHGFVPTLQDTTSSRRPGFTEDINLLTGTRITDSRSVAMHVTVLNERNQAIDYGRPLLLRGSVLPRYRGEGRWSQGQLDARLIENDQDEVRPLSSQPLDAGRTLRVRIDPQIRTQVLFAPMLPVAVLHPAEGDLRFDPSQQLIQTVRRSRPEPYAVHFQPMPSDRTLEQMGIPARPPADVFFEQQWNRDARPVLHRLQSIAAALLIDQGLETEPPADEFRQYAWMQQAARTFVNHLHSGAFTYTLDLSDVTLDGGEDSDPVVQFLTQTRRGHCEYFASAMALLCQSVGIDARVVTGFVAYEFDPSARSYLVLQSNAHAWVEVRTGPRRYSTFDPTPPASLQQFHATTATFTDRLRWVYERFDGAWSDQVIEFDRDAQRSMATNLDERWSQRIAGALESVREWAADVNRAFRIGSWGYIWMGIVALAIVIAIIAVVKITRRLLAVRRRARLEHVRGPEHQRLLRQLGFYVDMLTVLQRARLAKPPWQPPMMYAETISARRPGAAGTMRDIAELFYAARYGRQRLSRDDVSRARQLVAELAGELDVKVPR